MLPNGLMVKTSPLTMVARIRILVWEHRPDRPVIQRTLMKNKQQQHLIADDKFQPLRYKLKTMTTLALYGLLLTDIK